MVGWEEGKTCGCREGEDEGRRKGDWTDIREVGLMDAMMVSREVVRLDSLMDEVMVVHLVVLKVEWAALLKGDSLFASNVFLKVGHSVGR
jgi:hypothetical protein